MSIDWSAVYENGECPDCCDPIPDDTPDGGNCENCGHVFIAAVDPQLTDQEGIEA